MFNMDKMLDADRKKALASGKLQGTKVTKELKILDGINKKDWGKK